MKIEMDHTAKTFKDGFEEFIRYCTVRDYTESTITNYKFTIQQFNKFFPPLTHINTINSATIEDYILYLRQNTSMSNVSINIKLTRLKALFNYFVKQEYMSPVVFPKIRCEKKIKEVYTDDKLKALLVKPKLDSCKFTEYRNWVIVNYLLSTGNRRNTLVNVKIGDIDFENGVV